MGFLAALLLLISVVPVQPRPLHPNPVVHAISYDVKRNPEDCTITDYATTRNTPTPVLNNEGIVIVDFLVDDRGSVVAAEVLQSTGTISEDESVVKIVENWKFTPAMCGRHPSYIEGYLFFKQ